MKTVLFRKRQLNYTKLKLFEQIINAPFNTERLLLIILPRGNLRYRTRYIRRDTPCGERNGQQEEQRRRPWLR